MPETENGLKRKLSGLNGARFYDLEGVTYPKEVLRAKRGHDPKTGQPYALPPKWGITTAEAAKILGCSSSAARVMLTRKRVHFHLVSRPQSPPVIYWKCDRVERIAAGKLPLISDEEAAKMLMTEEAAEYLGVGRTTVRRAMKAKVLHPVLVRVNSPQGPRKRSYLLRGEVKLWACTLPQRACAATHTT